MELREMELREMELRERHPLIVVFAAAGLFWLAILLWLSALDYTMR